MSSHSIKQLKRYAARPIPKSRLKLSARGRGAQLNCQSHVQLFGCVRRRYRNECRGQLRRSTQPSIAMLEALVCPPKQRRWLRIIGTDGGTLGLEAPPTRLA